jgi:hypothetical protein
VFHRQQFWGYTARPDGEAERRAEVERRGEHVERVFAEPEAGSKSALADLLVEAGNCSSVVVAGPEELSPNVLTRRVILHEFRQRRVAVWSLGRWRWRECLSLKEQIDRLERTDYAASMKALEWWLSTFDLAQDAEAPACATVGEVIKESDKFRDLLRAAIQRQRQKQGKRPGRAAFGQQPDEKAVIHRILVWRRAGTGYTAIANKLNEEGYRTLTGKPFRPQTVKNYFLRYGGEGKEGAAQGGR